MTDLIYLALDFPDWQETEQFLTRHHLQGVPVKVGMELFYREGPAMIEKLKADNHSIFLDLKLHDIPTTVERAMKNLARLDVDIVNVHALGGSDMMKRAKEGLLAGGADQTRLLAVTILTSMSEQSMQQELGLQLKLDEQVTKLASLSEASGADGVVCSVHEVKEIKRLCGEDFLTVTPGIRLAASSQDDQERVATPAEASRLGADHLVMGRSITRAADPKAAYQEAIKETFIHGN
ncbi:orotidine-5'-phosphate decarboxylase [Oceanobacillus alkalisoli]|uniref:orotidine-5'-phosphate decarboxylase n=1 Tax=Oceanobacillus alkalisoli TaxID=2925113 RepID=UPI001EE4AC5F|nr:orotidine-5'-phosphate decarboxylase [Oceanobacillus alkalisoli]MCG5103552.1 orotidine-5'-phosphate decarboxylase [Oceanobacillus alkalisoli]